MINEVPTRTRTGERTEPFLMVNQKKSRVDSGSGKLPSLRRPERTNQPRELVALESLWVLTRKGRGCAPPSSEGTRRLFGWGA